MLPPVTVAPVQPVLGLDSLLTAPPLLTCASVARSPSSTTFSCPELAVAGYCSLAQEHQKQADRPPGLAGIGPCLGDSSPEGAPDCLVAIGIVSLTTVLRDSRSEVLKNLHINLIRESDRHRDDLCTVCPSGDRKGSPQHTHNRRTLGKPQRGRLAERAIPSAQKRPRSLMLSRTYRRPQSKDRQPSCA
jgi:hypothetical protein